MSYTERCDRIKSLKFPSSRRMKNLLDYIESTEAQASVINVYFKELGIVKYRKDELYGTKDLVAAVGGVMGLCLGFSLLSLAEFIYFFTLRLFVDHHKQEKNIAK